jgi:cell wall-associated NlpC family hydrolase
LNIFRIFFYFRQDGLLKVLILFIILSFTVGNKVYATPAPASTRSVGATKTVTKTSTVQAQKKGVTAKKKAKVVTQKYKVRPGDSLYTIARRHKMKLADLERLNGLNGLNGSRLKIGQVLVVSGKALKSGKAQADENVEESGQIVSQIALPNEEGVFADSLAEVGVEPIARTYLSIPYRYGAQSRKSTDCSGFVQQVFREFDIKLPRTAREQYTVGMKVDRASLASGDLLFFRTRAKKKYPTHVGIYLGNGKMIHASSRSRKVVISDVNHPYYVKRYVGAKRTATFLPGEIDLEMLARQVTGTDVDAPLAAAIVADVTDEIAAISMDSETVLTADTAAATGVLFDEDDAQSDDLGDDFDNDVEPEAEEIIPLSPQLGILPLPTEAFATDVPLTTDYAATTVSAQR